MIKLVVFDIAGTTVRDNNEVLLCFAEACRQEGITASEERLNALMGVSKLEVFHLLWREQLPEADDEKITRLAEQSFLRFREILETYYHTHTVEPTDGALEVFAWLREQNIKIALNTGFYRTVTNIILDKLNWQTPGSPIDYVIASDQVPKGRPEPYMIQNIMAVFGITDPKEVIKIGDTPVDLLEGRRAGCRLSLAVTNGTHTPEQLAELDNDGLLASLRDLPAIIAGIA
ncbi:MAG: HAD hydrolase-like protein [Saprospiraceae bacterium]|nr:HAD hydrolase-like protein [Saprospiraceae bacterium]